MSLKIGLNTIKCISICKVKNFLLKYLDVKKAGGVAAPPAIKKPNITAAITGFNSHFDTSPTPPKKPVLALI